MKKKIYTCSSFYISSFSFWLYFFIFLPLWVHLMSGADLMLGYPPGLPPRLADALQTGRTTTRHIPGRRGLSGLLENFLFTRLKMKISNQGKLSLYIVYMKIDL